MRVMLVVDHPYGAGAWDNVPHRRSMTVALAHAAQVGLEKAGHEVDLVDLHGDGFNPVMSADDLVAWRTMTAPPDPLAADYQARLLQADHLVLAFPSWWEVMPAMTKGFIDKVIAKGVVYRSKPGWPPMQHLTKLRGVSLITVMSTPTPLYRIIFGNPVEKALFRGTFRKMGIKNTWWFNLGNSEKQPDAKRQQALATVERHFAALT